LFACEGVSGMEVKNEFSVSLLRAAMVPLTSITVSHLPRKLCELVANLTDLKEMHTNEIFSLSKLIYIKMTNSYLRIPWHCTDVWGQLTHSLLLDLLCTQSVAQAVQEPQS
jgi:hypothetical protein